MNTRTVAVRARPCLAAFVLVLPLALASSASAQSVIKVPVTREESRAPAPPEPDSLAIWAAQAKAGFASNPGDSAGGENYRPYERVGLIGRRLLRALGRRDLMQAHVLVPALDSLGFTVEVATDPASPTFALLMVRNPDRYTADAVGFLYWYKGDDLRIQGALFKGGYHPRIRVWRTGRPEYPYEWGILDQTRAGTQRFTMLRLSPGGMVWGIQQDEEGGPLLGEPGEAAWLDLNQDGRPELVSWTRSATDSLFTECADCPKLLTERTFIEGREGFEMQDERLLPTPYATLVYFVRLLIDGKLTQAERLVRDPAKVREAVAQGWNQRRVRKPWTVESGESGQSWPRRLALRFEGPQGVKRYGVIFAKHEGRWIIDNWFEPRPTTRNFPSVTTPPAAPAKPPVRPARRERPGREAPGREAEDDEVKTSPAPLPPASAPARPRGARRPARTVHALALVPLLGVVALGTLFGCNRQPRFVPASADSSLAVPADSLAEQVRVMQERWTAPGGGEEAARLTAQVLLQELRVRQAEEPGAPWVERARALLDSLDVGAELVGSHCALGVNFFSRGDPTAGSWPWLFWCAGTTVQAQAVEGAGMGLAGLAARGLAGEPADPARPPGIAALFARRSGGGLQPMLLAWRVAGERLELAQTLGPDSLGGVGTGTFEQPADSADVLATRTWRPTPRFDECATCPHVFHQRRFQWGLEGFASVADELVPTPYVAFVQFIQALTGGDRDGAAELATRPALVESARRAGWATVKGPWRAAPGSEERHDELVFYRGGSEAWKVRFARRDGGWRVDSFEPASRVIE